jgi:hypothetical protein
MSGGGGRPSGGTSGGGPPGIPGASDCASLSDRLTLVSPVPEVLDGLRRDTILHLVAENPESGPLLALTEDGQAAGAIPGAFAIQLMRCMREGHAYIAGVVLIDHGRCIVDIRHE